MEIYSFVKSLLDLYSTFHARAQDSIYSTPSFCFFPMTTTFVDDNGPKLPTGSPTPLLSYHAVNALYCEATF